MFTFFAFTKDKVSLMLHQS